MDVGDTVKTPDGYGVITSEDRGWIQVQLSPIEHGLCDYREYRSDELTTDV